MIPAQWYVAAPVVIDWCARQQPPRTQPMPVWMATILLALGVAGLLWLLIHKRWRQFWPFLVMLVLFNTLMGWWVWTRWPTASTATMSESDREAWRVGRTPQERWWNAIRDGRVEGMADRLAETGEGVDQLNEDGQTALQVSVNRQQLKNVSELLKLGADPVRNWGEHGSNAIDMAWQQPEMLALLDAYDSAQRRPLVPASHPKLVQQTRDLLERLRQPDYRKLERDAVHHYIHSHPPLWKTDWPAAVAHLVEPLQISGWTTGRRARVCLGTSEGQWLQLTFERPPSVEQGADEDDVHWRLASLRLAPAC